MVATSIGATWFGGFVVLSVFVLLVAPTLVVAARRRLQPEVVVAAALAVTFIWGFGFSVVRRDTGLGILVLRGADFWVHRALTAGSRDERLSSLRRIVDSSTYGCNAAEAAVLRLPLSRQRADLFMALAEVAPNLEWRHTFLEHAVNGRPQ